MDVGLVVACTNRKTTDPVVRLGDVRRHAQAPSMGALFAEWTTRLCQGRNSGTVPVRSLYSGVAWAASRDAESALDGAFDHASTWVLSAGYGLVSADAELVPYAATFSPGKADSVARASTSHGVANQRWWHHLASWRPTNVDGPRNFRDLVDAVDALMVVMSPRYLLAAESDLLAACRAGTPVVIVSGGLPRSHALARYAVDFDKRLREPEAVTGAPRLLRASDMSLNQRVAEHLLVQLGAEAFDLGAASAHLDAEMSKRQAARRFGDRASASDDEVLDFIESALVGGASTSKTRLLAEWRASGRQCEQKRFGRLYALAREALELAEVDKTEEAFL